MSVYAIQFGESFARVHVGTSSYMMYFVDSSSNMCKFTDVNTALEWLFYLGRETGCYGVVVELQYDPCISKYVPIYI